MTSECSLFVWTCTCPTVALWWLWHHSMTADMVSRMNSHVQHVLKRSLTCSCDEGCMAHFYDRQTLFSSCFPFKSSVWCQIWNIFMLIQYKVCFGTSFTSLSTSLTLVFFALPLAFFTPFQTPAEIFYEPEIFYETGLGKTYSSSALVCFGFWAVTQLLHTEQ